MIFKHFCAMFSALVLAGTVGAAEEKVLNIFNWSDYIAPDTISNFAAEFGIKVNYDLYDSTEIVEAKLLAGQTAVRSGQSVRAPLYVGQHRIRLQYRHDSRAHARRSRALSRHAV